MGVTLQWRQPPDRENRSFSKMVEFGRGRSACRAYMSYSDRVGPGVVVVGESGAADNALWEYADALNVEGFTALVPDLSGGTGGPGGAAVRPKAVVARSADVELVMPKLEAAVDFLADNWHPRVGVVGFALGACFAGELAQRKPVDGTVLHYGVPQIRPRAWTGPVLGHFGDADDSAAEAFDSLREHGVEAELCVYPNAQDAAEEAFARTVDFLLHHLS